MMTNMLYTLTIYKPVGKNQDFITHGSRFYLWYLF